MKTLESAEALYGPMLQQASRTELIGIVSAIGLELECRHHPEPIPDGLADLINEESDEQLITLAIAASLRLRMPTSIHLYQEAA